MKNYILTRDRLCTRCRCDLFDDEPTQCKGCDAVTKTELRLGQGFHAWRFIPAKKVLLACIEAYFGQKAHDVQKVLDITRGLSPECVAACVEAVRAERDWQKYALTDGEGEFYIKAESAMDAAIALLPKEGT